MSEPEPTTQRLAKFACDHCRAKRLKCSRELPKCGNCRPWRAPCLYSHTTPDRKRHIETRPQTQSVTKITSTARVPTPLQDRLAKIEFSLAELLDKTRQHGQAKETTSQPSPQSNKIAPPTEAGDDNTLQTSIYQDWSEMLNPLSQIMTDLEILKASLPCVPTSLDGPMSLQDLSKNLRAVEGPNESVREDLRQAEISANLFYIPNREEGDSFIETFRSLIQLAYPLCLPPADELIPEIVYKPFSIIGRGWVVIFNYFMLSALPADKYPHSSRLRDGFRRNTWIALNDTSLFLKPRMVNILALIAIASHGEDFTTPNLSWILTGHACRLLQAMSIHLSLGTPGSQTYIHRLFVFWSLFCIDKSVPTPTLADLADFKPHSRTSKESTYGAYFFIQRVHLAKLQGKVLELRQLFATAEKTGYRAKKNQIKEELRLWHTETQKILCSSLASEILGCSNDEVMELKTGLESMAFQHHHLLVLLTNHDTEDRQECLCASRDAISTLLCLVSTSAQVYNGIVWQLLYYPFTPFFVIFSNLISAPLVSSAAADVELLRSTSFYLGEMTSLGSMAAKLQTIAGVFSSLGDLYVRDMVRKRQDRQAPSDKPLEDWQLSAPIYGSEIPNTLVAGGSDGMGGLLDWLSTADFRSHDMPDEYLEAINSDNIVASLAGQAGETQFDYSFDWFRWDLLE